MNYRIVKQKNGWKKVKWEELSSKEIQYNSLNSFENYEEAQKELRFISGEDEGECECTDEEIQKGLLNLDIWKYKIVKINNGDKK